jgi:hypothetical protein
LPFTIVGGLLVAIIYSVNHAHKSFQKIGIKD